MKSIGIFIFDEIEVLDLGGPFEVFTTASRIYSRLYPSSPNFFEVFTIADAIRDVRARGGLLLRPNYILSDHPPIDVLVIPGGAVAAELERHDVIDWIASVSLKAGLTTSVCTGAFLLAKAGLLKDKSVTTHWEDIEDLKKMFPDINVVSGRRWIADGRIVSSAGVSSGIDMSLHLVEKFTNPQVASLTARQMDYGWQRSTIP